MDSHSQAWEQWRNLMVSATQATINGTAWLDRDYDGKINSTVDLKLGGVVFDLVQVRHIRLHLLTSHIICQIAVCCSACSAAGARGIIWQLSDFTTSVLHK